MANSDDDDPNYDQPHDEVAKPRAAFAAYSDILDRIWTKLRYSKLARVAAGYAATALAIASGHELIAEALEWPPSPQRVVIGLLVAGLPLALTITWMRGRRTRLHKRRDQAIVLAACLISVGLFAAIARNWGADATIVAADTPPPGPPTDLVTFRDCATCPEMAVLPAGSFMMGSDAAEDGHAEDEGPPHRVTIATPFAVGRFEVTWIEWNACVRLGGCPDAGVSNAGGDEGWGGGSRPVINTSWDDAQAYVAWLRQISGKPYRLLTESEWEYAARAASTGPFFFGRTITPMQANYDWNYSYGGSPRTPSRTQTSPTGSFPPNAFGLYDMHGNVWEWVEDCYLPNYARAPTDGSAVLSGGCERRVRRGGSWFSNPAVLRSAVRYAEWPTDRFWAVGFRVARAVEPSEISTR